MQIVIGRRSADNRERWVAEAQSGESGASRLRADRASCAPRSAIALEQTLCGRRAKGRGCSSRSSFGKIGEHVHVDLVVTEIRLVLIETETAKPPADVQSAPHTRWVG